MMEYDEEKLNRMWRRLLQIEKGYIHLDKQSKEAVPEIMDMIIEEANKCY